MEYKKGYLLILLCGLLLVSGIHAQYDDSDDSNDYDGSRDRAFPPEDRSFPSEGPEDRPFSPQGGAFPPDRFGPFPERGRPFSPQGGAFPPDRFGPFPERGRPFSPRRDFFPPDRFGPFPDRERPYPDRDQGQGGDNYNEFIRPFDLSYLTKKKDPYFSAICTAKDRCVSNCDSTYQDGCICYNDGTCTQQYVNRCHQCTDPNVFAVFEGSSCPRSPYPEICSQIDQDQNDEFGSKRHSKHRVSSKLKGSSKLKASGLKVICSGEKLKSCVCDLQGDCNLKMLDICDVCQSSHYAAIFLNSTCPDTSLQATCTSASVIPPSTTCNYPQAYTCKDQDRTSMQCNLQSSSKACVCYSNGTCASQPSSACACQNTDIVSVFAGSYCPTNCTKNATQGTGQEEESEESETKTENEEAEKNEEAEESEAQSNKTQAGNTTVNNQNSTLMNISDQFTPNNLNRFTQCTLPYAYTCQQIDRGASNCSETLVDSCICNNAGVCISMSTNKCKACANSDVATVFENGSCSSRCTKLDTQNSTLPAQSNQSTVTPSVPVDVSPITPPNQNPKGF